MTDTTPTSDPYREIRELAEQFHNVESERAAANVAVDAAVDSLGATAAALYGVEDGEFTVRSVRADTLYGGARRTVEEGVVGEAYRSDETVLVSDTTESEMAAPTGSYGSAIAVPVADGVFEVLATLPDAFDATDRSVVELLGTMLAESLDRLRSAAQAERERDQFAALFDNVPDAAIQYVRQGTDLEIETVNTAFVKTFGYDPSTATGQSITELLVPEDESPVEREQAAADSDREVTRLTSDGEKPFLLRRVPIGDESGRGYCIYADISELKDRERELQRQNERLDRFASVVSHDLRNPLNVAQARASMALEGSPEEHIPAVESAHERMNAIIDDALTMAREGEAVAETSPTQLASVARDAWRTVEAPEASFETDADIEIQADRSRLRRVLENLFRNAVEHGDADATIRVRTTDRGFAVDDDGPGIPEDKYEQVFEPGHTTNTEGTGLGLPIVREIARAHGWDVVASESPEGGARFEFLLDASDIEPTA